MCPRMQDAHASWQLQDEDANVTPIRRRSETPEIDDYEWSLDLNILDDTEVLQAIIREW